MMFVGCHGVGKSELLQQAAADMNIGFISRDLSLMEPPDLVGLPTMDGGVTRYLPPQFLPTRGKGLLVFEELNRCEKYMRAPCLQLLTARVLNDYQLPPGWLPVAAINPSTDAYDVFELDTALLSRFVQVKLVPDQQEWLEWARRHGIHPAVIDYVERDPSTFDTPHSSPRAWKYISDIISANKEVQSDPTTLRAAVVGIVGNERGTAFLRSLERHECPLSADAILRSYAQHRHQVQGWITDGKLDMIKATLLTIEKYLQPKGDYEAVKADIKRWNRLARFLHDLPGDLLADAKAYFAERGYSFPTCRRQWR
jgi:hypothetical protein